MADGGGSEPKYRAIALDDEAPLVRGLKRLLEPYGFAVETFTDGAEALAAVERDGASIDVMLCDVSMPGMDGIEVVQRVRAIAPELPVVMLTGDRSAGTAVRALKAGAFNYLNKPPSDADEVVEVLTRAVEVGRLRRHARRLEQHISAAQRFERIIGSCAPMRELFEAMDRVAALDVSVMILGESGTGKELVARSIHERSGRSSGPFVALNCAAVPESLVDSELFGHARGAFTGAVEARAGAFERADGGTLFLDEIGDVPAPVQVRLLRVLQEGEVVRLGEGTPRPVNVRVLGATWVDLEAAVESGDLRPDLYYRLNVVALQVPALRNRREDLPLLIAHLAHKHAERMGRTPPSFAGDAVEALCRYHWPGNVRELENAIQRALAMSTDDEIPLAALPRTVIDAPPMGAPAGDDDFAWAEGLSLAEARKLAVERFERGYLTQLLKRAQGNISEASRLAQIDRSNLRRIMGRAGIEASDYKT
jgi:DNA-binding NtrC family response regulator